VGFFSSVIVAFYTLIFNFLIDPDYQKNTMDKIAYMTEEFMTNSGLSEEMIETQMQQFRNQPIPSPVSSAFMVIPGSLIMFTIISLITSIFVKKKGDIFQNDNKEIQDSSN
jgi:hypothetical protein